MLILDKGYFETRNKFVKPLSDYVVPYRHLRNANIKNVLLTKTKNVERCEDKGYKFYFNESDLLKGLLGDILLFYIRSILQKNDFDQVTKNSDFSANWNIVTNYYLAFFNASLLLRLCHRGNIFFDKQSKKNLEYIISTMIGEIIEIDSNQFFAIERINDEYVLILSRSEANTHEVVWKKVHGLLNEILLLSNLESEERAFLLSCQCINQKLTDTFPSQLRNRVNYQPVYGIEFLEKNLFSIKQNENWVKEIIGFDINEVKNNDKRLVNVFSAYTTYIEKLSYRLIQDYFQMKGNGDYILSQVNKCREKRIEINEIGFVY